MLHIKTSPRTVTVYRSVAETGAGCEKFLIAREHARAGPLAAIAQTAAPYDHPMKEKAA
jgi:hypothetical protein